MVLGSLLALAPGALARPALEDVSDLVAQPVAGIGDGLHGVAWLDFDADGDLDLFHTNGLDAPALMFRNDGAAGFAEVAAAVGADVRTGASGVLAADLDGDGAVDLLLAGDGSMQHRVQSPAVLLRNLGDGTFADVTAASGLGRVMPPTSMAFTAGDLDGDGDLDLFVAAPGRVLDAHFDRNVLLRNDGDRFVDISAGSGVDEARGSCVATFAHLDDDALVDLVVGHCLDPAAAPLRLFHNLGGGRFEDRAPALGVWTLGYWMGLALADLDGDGATDLFATNTGSRTTFPHVLYLGGGDRWPEVSLEAGLDAPEYGWGTAAADLDSDGREDLVMAGSPRLAALADLSSPGHLWGALPDGGFEEVPLPLDLRSRGVSGLAVADYDRDGRPDLALGVGPDPATRALGAPVLLHNVSEGGRSVTVILDQPPPNTAAVGARIFAQTPSGARMRREILAGSSFASTSSPWPTFGLGEETELALCVRWPDGASESFGTVPAGSEAPLRRGEGSPVVDCTAEPVEPCPLPPAQTGCATGGRPPAGLGLLGALLGLAVRRRGAPLAVALCAQGCAPPVQPPDPPPAPDFEQLATAAGFVVRQGTMAFLDPADCCAECGNCLWNNPSTPYGSYALPPAPDQTAPDPAPNAAGPTFYLRPDEAVVFLGRTPPQARYFSFRSYLSERVIRPDDPIPPDLDDCTEPAELGSRVPVLGSLGPSLNHAVIAEALGDPYDRAIAIVTSADAAVEAKVSALLAASGHDPAAVFVDRIPAGSGPLGLRLGLDPSADSFQMAIRVAVYADPEAGARYQEAPGQVLRLSPAEPSSAAQPHDASPLPPIGTGTDESALAADLDRLGEAIRARYPDVPSYEQQSQQWDFPTYDCIGDLYCSGEIRDRYYARVPRFRLPSDREFAVAYGVNHERTGKASYANVSVDTVENYIGLRALDSGQMPGTAAALLPGDPRADDLYAWVIARDCSAHQGLVCYELPEVCPEGLPLEDWLLVSFRAYLEPATGAKPLGTELVPDRVLLFVPEG